MTKPTETVTLPKSEYDELKDDQMRLRALEHSGVDNWEWYGDAMAQYEEWKAEANDPAIHDPDGEAEST